MQIEIEERGDVSGVVWRVWCEVLGGETAIFHRGSADLEPMDGTEGWVELPEARRGKEAKDLRTGSGAGIEGGLGKQMTI